METVVLYLCGIWLWLTRRRRTSRYSEVADTLHSARTYLWTDYATRASTLDRGSLLPEQHEALIILERQAALVVLTSRRFASLSECRKLISEEFTQPQKAA
jgi:hypothetical protein